MFAFLKVSAALRACALALSIFLLAGSVGVCLGPETVDHSSEAGLFGSAATPDALQAAQADFSDEWRRDTPGYDEGLDAVESEFEEESFGHKWHTGAIECAAMVAPQADAVSVFARQGFRAKKRSWSSTGFPRGPPAQG